MEAEYLAKIIVFRVTFNKTTVNIQIFSLLRCDLAMIKLSRISYITGQIQENPDGWQP